ncbi:succinylglutamate-semialdehyde dehydrogenase [Sphingomonas histidinilytica]|uniref:Succinylglutamic semialdehyde dehydrogenase n=1 Tax=Rhizorhabdus histidinilytica TaxID=439228 RepID=A0A1T5F462_9SPHN|nr:succinylglutamate-semialdehyde dehydrogenase [Rhizorhabdus histidinilytica]MBO9377189.1 succinylglutamate-semialdehyde dehydrogenase [Rhizorhabdus histidinilytica]SKB90929.1 succinylglutamic semialdehyde dehydrogenase [Rhizorhabdus histidinilytica]
MMRSIDPATGQTVWEGEEIAVTAIPAMVERARAALAGWADRPVEERVAIVERYAALLKERTDDIARDMARETGKPLWETRAELGSMINKVAVSIAAQAERAGSRRADTAFGRAVLRHKPHGVMAVLGPYNFPGHLPNGHIVPALLAGNTVLFKPSEEAPLTGENMTRALHDAGVPEAVFQLVQGGRDQGAALIGADIDGLLFTGAASTGAHFRRAMIDRPHVILALELGGNNPLIAWGDAETSAAAIVQSAFITTGQRCSCARRLILPEGSEGDATIEAVHTLAARLRIGAWDDAEEPYMGPLISARAAQGAIDAVAGLKAKGARTLLPFERLERSEAFVTPGMYDVTGLDVPDAEIFAPVLQVIRVSDFDAAIAAANDTSFGLSAGLLADDPELWRRFLARARAGVVNWNRPTTGAAANMPFGGLGQSGNHRPSAYYAADYCAYPVASFEADTIADLTGELGGRLL